MVTLHVNGKPQQVDVPPDTPLLWALRDVLGLTGTKYGCGMALRGACTVHLDGQAVRSCMTPLSAVANRCTSFPATSTCRSAASGSLGCLRFHQPL